MVTEVIDRRSGQSGEVVLRRDGSHFEIIANGIFLMDSRNGESEQLMVRAAANMMPAGSRLLVGGLGVGFSLRAALDHPAVGEVVVVEREAAVIEWNRGPLRHLHGDAMTDQSVRCVQADIGAWLAGCGERFGAICLDVDNGPEWTVVDSNADLYRDAGLDLLAGRLSPGGVLAVWSAARSEVFAAALRARFTRVEEIAVPVPRGEPDVVFLAVNQPAYEGGS